MAQRLEVLWRIASHCDIRKSPFSNVFGKNTCAPAVDLVAHYLTAFGHGADGSRALATRRGAKVETSHRLLDQVTDDMGNEHARSFLNVIGTGMEQRIERELRALT